MGSACKAPAFNDARLPERGEAFQQELHRSGAAPLEGAGDLFGGGLTQCLC
jgi:hypothetical protein